MKILTLKFPLRFMLSPLWKIQYWFALQTRQHGIDVISVNRFTRTLKYKSYSCENF